MNKNKNFKRGLSKSVQDQRDFEIVSLRIQGRKLKDIGDSLGITRERVRQLETRGKRDLIEFMEDSLQSGLLKPFIDNKCINKNKIKKEVGEDLWDMVVYAYQTKNKRLVETKIEYSYILETLVCFGTPIDEVHSLMKKESKSFESVFTDEVLEIFIERMKKHHVYLNKGRASTALSNLGYSTFGEFTLDSNINIGESIRNEVKYNYPNGVSTSDEEQILELRNIVQGKYKHKNLTMGSIVSRVQQSLFLWDQAMYIHEDNISITDDLSDDIIEYIHDMQIDRISYNKLYDIFEEDIKTSTNFINHHSLHGYLISLRDLEDEDIICVKSYVCKPDINNIGSKYYYKEVYDLLMEYPNGLTDKEIVEHIPEFDKSLLRYASSYYPEIIKRGRNLYMNLASMPIPQEDKDQMKDILDSLLDNKIQYSSKYILFDFYKKNHLDFLQKYNLDKSKNILFHLNKYLFGENILFNSPHIVKGESKRKSNYTVEDLMEKLLELDEDLIHKEAKSLALKIYKNEIDINNLFLEEGEA